MSGPIRSRHEIIKGMLKLAMDENRENVVLRMQKRLNDAREMPLGDDARLMIADRADELGLTGQTRDVFLSRQDDLTRMLMGGWTGPGNAFPN